MSDPLAQSCTYTKKFQLWKLKIHSVEMKTFFWMIRTNLIWVRIIHFLANHFVIIYWNKNRLEYYKLYVTKDNVDNADIRFQTYEGTATTILNLNQNTNFKIFIMQQNEFATFKNKMCAVRFTNFEWVIDCIWIIRGQHVFVFTYVERATFFCLAGGRKLRFYGFRDFGTFWHERATFFYWIELKITISCLFFVINFCFFRIYNRSWDNECVYSCAERRSVRPRVRSFIGCNNCLNFNFF